MPIFRYFYYFLFTAANWQDFLIHWTSRFKTFAFFFFVCGDIFIENCLKIILAQDSSPMDFSLRNCYKTAAPQSNKTLTPSYSPLLSEFEYFVQKLSSIFFISNKWNLIQIVNESQFIGWKWQKLVFEQKFDTFETDFYCFFEGQNAS